VSCRKAHSIAALVGTAAALCCVSAPPADAGPRPAGAPSGYRLPNHAVHVRSSIGLVSALLATRPTNIVLGDGVYDHARPFLNPNGHRLYAARRGGAIFRAGISLGGNSGSGGALVQGLAFDVKNPAKTLTGGVVTIWGTGKRSRVLDSTFTGNDVIGAGVFAKQLDGLVVRRVKVFGFTSYGVYADPNPNFAYAPRKAPVLEDLTISNVSHASPRSSNGRAEACLWIGSSATVRRIKLRKCAGMGLWTGTANRGALHEDLDIDGTPTGIYAEHYTRGSTFRNFSVGPNVEIGVKCEWADPAWSSLPGCDGAVFESGRFETSLVGVYLDAGTSRTTVRNNVFVGQSWAGIGDHLGVSNAYSGNDFSRIDAGASATTTAHINTGG
jgi:hypothetical protein